MGNQEIMSSNILYKLIRKADLKAFMPNQGIKGLGYVTKLLLMNCIELGRQEVLMELFNFKVRLNFQHQMFIFTSQKSQFHPMSRPNHNQYMQFNFQKLNNYNYPYYKCHRTMYSKHKPKPQARLRIHTLRATK